MGQYGGVAVSSAKLMAEGTLSPLAAWNLACTNLIASASSRKKGCPRKAFLGLCAAGFLNSTFINDYDVEEAINSKNGKYAMVAVEFLRAQPQLAKSKHNLWVKVLNSFGDDLEKKHNGQMDVVISLWENGYIVNNLHNTIGKVRILPR